MRKIQIKEKSDDEIAKIVGQIEGSLKQLDLTDEDTRLLQFKNLKTSKWRRPEVHQVEDILVYVWRYQLTPKEKYILWFEYFSTGE